jgi:DNA repair exonuclease SbcCD ATPase subunit
MEGYAGRFAGLEKSLQVATETLSAEISSEVARLEKEMVGKNSDLNGQLAESRRALQEESARLASQHEQDTRKLADQISQLQATLDHKIEDLAAKFDKATTAFHKQMQAQHVDLLNTLDARIRELSSVKADRATLATLLTDLAGNLTAESGSREVK